MRILIDTNVILDVLLKRSPFYETAIEVLKLSARDDIQEFVSASAITDIYYIAYKNLRDKAAVRELLKKLLLIVSVAGVSEEEIQKALELEWNDFEDSVQYSVAALNEMDGIITRNVKDYSSAEISAVFGAYFCCFVRTKLSSFYDENSVNIFYDGPFRMNVPGVKFNNRNWPHIVRTLRLSLCLCMILFPIINIVAGSIVADVWENIGKYVFLAMFLCGVLLPIYVVGKKYE